MRNNQPVTQRQYAIPADAAIVSRTDAQGRIAQAIPWPPSASGSDGGCGDTAALQGLR